MNWVELYDATKPEELAEQYSIILADYDMQEDKYSQEVSILLENTLAKNLINQFKSRIYDRMVQNCIHRVKRYQLGILPESLYQVWLLGQGQIHTGVRAQPTRAMRGRTEQDEMVHHRFNGSELNQIPLFGENWYIFHFQEPNMGGRHLVFKLQYLTLSYNLTRQFLDCTFGYDVYAYDAAFGWVMCC
jgi:hypothetical protein